MLSTRRRGGKTYDDVIRGLLDEEEYPEEFLRELDRRYRDEPRVRGDVVLQRLRLL